MTDTQRSLNGGMWYPDNFTAAFLYVEM